MKLMFQIKQHNIKREWIVNWYQNCVLQYSHFILCFTILAFYIMFYNTRILYYVLQYSHFILCFTILAFYIMFYNTRILYYVLQYSHFILCFTILAFYIMFYNTRILYYVLQYSHFILCFTILAFYIMFYSHFGPLTSHFSQLPISTQRPLFNTILQKRQIYFCCLL